MSAADTLDFRLEPIRGGRRGRRIVANVVMIVVGAATQMGWQILALTELGILRRDGEELLRGDAPTSDRGWLTDQLRRDLRSMDEQRFLTKWGDPSQWRKAL